ncbi:hypothetical protein JOM56_014480 [Amanita muscaria]
MLNIGCTTYLHPPDRRRAQSRITAGRNESRQDVSSSSNVADSEREDGSLIITEEKGGDQMQERSYHGGLGLKFKFKFPGDPKKLREASKINLPKATRRTHS